MTIEKIEEEGNENICRIELTLDEAKALGNALQRTNCRGYNLTVSTVIEDELYQKIINPSYY